MGNRRSGLLVLSALAGWISLSLLWAQPPGGAERTALPPPTQSPGLPSAPTPPGEEPAETKVVDFTADLMRPVKVGDSSALSLVGHVVFHHNGTVITCDSAIRYNDRQMDCFRNVIVNQDSVFIYGDWLEYNGFENVARVYAPLVKVVDKDAVFYTYNFSFNTLDNIGHYTGGGTVLQGDNRLESQEGFYYSDNRLLIAIRDVEMENPDYRMRTDSVTYDMNTEVASFFTRSHIWNSKDEFLTALRGDYDRKAEKYTFTDHSYVLTETQEIWADTLIYTQSTGDALLLNNVQLVDDEQRALAFGDYVRYWGQERKAVLTRRPVVASYEEDGADTLYLRADSMFIYTINRFDSLRADTLSDVDLSDSPDPSLADRPEAESPGEESQPSVDLPDATDAAESDSVLTEKIDVSLSAKQQKALLKKERREAKRKARDEAYRAKLAKRRGGAERLQRAAAHADSLARADSLAAAAAALDSLTRAVADTLPPAAPPDSVAAGDSLIRRMFAYRDVRVFRSDFQAVCDSMTAFTIDSTAHMYIGPVLWNDNNQITSTHVDIYTRNQSIDRALFIGEPIMSSEMDLVHYNQIKGKVMEVFFRDGTIHRTDVNGNGQMYYYMEDKDSLGRYLTGFMTLECADMSFYFEPRQPDLDDPGEEGAEPAEGATPEAEPQREQGGGAAGGQELVSMTSRGNPDYVVYPMDKIPGDQSLFLPGFTWEEKRRPRFEDVMDRTIRPSEREHYEALDKPLYPITERINLDRERLVRDRLWRDRTDQLGAEALDFLRTLR